MLLLYQVPQYVQKLSKPQPVPLFLVVGLLIAGIVLVPYFVQEKPPDAVEQVQAPAPVPESRFGNDLGIDLPLQEAEELIAKTAEESKAVIEGSRDQLVASTDRLNEFIEARNKRLRKEAREAQAAEEAAAQERTRMRQEAAEHKIAAARAERDRARAEAVRAQAEAEAARRDAEAARRAPDAVQWRSATEPELKPVPAPVIQYVSNEPDYAPAGEPIRDYTAPHRQRTTQDEYHQPYLGFQGTMVAEGMWIASVAHGSPAASIGLEQGDIIVQVNDHKVNSRACYLNALNDSPDLCSVLVRNVRNGQLEWSQVQIRQSVQYLTWNSLPSGGIVVQ